MDFTILRSFLRPSLLSVGCILIAATLTVAIQRINSEQLEVDMQSAYSHIRIRRHQNVRTLLFVRDDGREVVESRMNINAPQRLLLSYSQVMFASYLFCPDPTDVLIVGLGGGSMVRFLEHHDPDLNIDVLEIDPVIVELAATHFGTRSTNRVRILTADAFDYLANSEKPYDVIYMDAFLKPSVETDATGVPQRLKTIEFYQTLRRQLKPQGVVVFNLNSHAATEADIAVICQSFPPSYVFPCPRSTNQVAVGLSWPAGRADIAARAVELDRRFDADFSFQAIWRSRRQHALSQTGELRTWSRAGQGGPKVEP